MSSSCVEVAEEPLGSRAMLEKLSDAEPGPATMAMLSGIDSSQLDEWGAVELARQWQRQECWVAAQLQSALATVMVSPRDVESPWTLRPMEELEWRHDLVAAALRWSPVTAGGRMGLAQSLAGPLSATRELLRAGEISLRHAMVLNELLLGLDPDVAAAVEARVLARAPLQTVAEFRRSVRRAVLAAAPELGQARHVEAVAERGVRRVAEPDGMASLIVTMSAPDIDAVFLGLDAVARKAAAAAGPDEPPVSTDARRADALLAWAIEALADPQLPTQQGRRVETQIVVDLPTLLGLADNPAELIGYGPIPASMARELAADSKWRRLVVDPVDGHLLDFGTQTYRPPQALADYICARDRRCRFMGCSMRAERCDIDHATPASSGGETSSCNCGALCRRHHLLKTHGGWQLESFADGSCRWTAPTGHPLPRRPVRPTRCFNG